MKEKKEKHQRWLEMLRVKDNKRYKKELELDRQREEKLEHQRAENAEKEQKKKLAAEARAPKTLDPIKGLIG